MWKVYGNVFQHFTRNLLQKNRLIYENPNKDLEQFLNLHNDVAMPSKLKTNEQLAVVKHGLFDDFILNPGKLRSYNI